MFPCHREEHWTCKAFQKFQKAIEIKPEAVDPEDIEFLQDLVVSAVNEATRKVDELVESEMGSVTGGMNLPGMNLPGLG